MAWYAELKRRHWYCINGTFMIQEFSKYLYEQWYSSLTDEQREALALQKKQEEEKRQKELRITLAQLACLTTLVSGPRLNKYNGVYDEFGYPTK